MSMQRCGIDAIEAALDAGEDITRVLALRDCADPVSYTHLTLPTNREV